MDLGPPNYGFTHFDNMAAALLADFQYFTADGGYVILWAAIQSEPVYFPLTIGVFICVCLSVFPWTYVILWAAIQSEPVYFPPKNGVCVCVCVFVCVSVFPWTYVFNA